MEQAKRLLIETDLPLSEIGLQVWCADQSHCTALFRSPVSFTPKAYRDHARSEDVTMRSHPTTVP
jgi:AraC family transcriptional regulator